MMKGEAIRHAHAYQAHKIPKEAVKTEMEPMEALQQAYKQHGITDSAQDSQKDKPTGAWLVIWTAVLSRKTSCGFAVSWRLFSATGGEE
jgi:hypothetical protein